MDVYEGAEKWATFSAEDSTGRRGGVSTWFGEGKITITMIFPRGAVLYGMLYSPEDFLYAVNSRGWRIITQMGARLDNPQAGIWHGLIVTITVVPECELGR